MFDVNPLTLTMNAVIVKLLLSNIKQIYIHILCVYIVQKKEEIESYTRRRGKKEEIYSIDR